MTLRAHYACYARWTYSATTYAVGTDDATRSGVDHDPVLASDPDLARRFQEGVALSGSQYQLVIADGVGGTYRTLVAGSVLDGTQVTVETVATVTALDGTTSEQTVKQVLTVQGTRLEPGRVILTLIDMDDAKLDTLYPVTVYNADLFRDIDGGFAGRAIPFAVGTARKFACPQIFADTVGSQWFFGVCDASITSVAIGSVNTGAKQFVVAGDYTDRISAGTIVYCTASAGNPGRFTVTAASYSAPNTTITVSETVSSSTSGGFLWIPPTVLSVYRNGRLVSSSEYTVHLIYPPSGQIGDSDFDNSPATWTATSAGSGSAALTGGKARMTGDGGTTNYGLLTTGDTTPTTLPGSYLLATLTISAGSRVRLHSNNVAVSTLISDTGTHTAPVFQGRSDGRARVSISNYSTGSSATTDVDDLALDQTKTMLMLKFSREQVDFDGQPYQITADVRGDVSRNAVSEIARILSVLGVTTETTSFSTAAAYSSTNEMLVDCDYGNDGESGQRRARAILDELLTIARATLTVNDSGQYVITQDRTGSSTETLIEDEGDLVEVMSFERPARPTSVGLRYAPNPRDPSQLTYVATRSVSGGTMAAETPLDVRFVSNGTVADRLLCYLALRAQYSGILRFRRLGAQRAIGDVVTITSPASYPGARAWVIRSVRQIPGGCECEAIEYDASIHTYTAGTIPTGATVAYQPDYSQTPPAAPTGMTITAGAVATGNDGTMTARVTVKATPPSVNWAEIWFAVQHNTTGEIPAMVMGSSIGGGEYGCTLTGIRPGEVYKLTAWAVNASSVQGTARSTFNASPIGGSSSTTTFTAPGQTAVPSDVSSITVAQGMGRIVNVSWPAVTAAALWGYVVERQIGAGSWAEVFRGQATTWRDTELAIGDSVGYRVKSRDTYGNLATNWRTSGSTTLVSNIVGGNPGGGSDIDDATVDSVNRTATTGVSVTYVTVDGANMLATGYLIKTVPHSLGKLPVVGGVVISRAGVIGAVRSPTSSTIEIMVMGSVLGATGEAGSVTFFSSSYVKTEIDSHYHIMAALSITNGDTATAYIW